MPMSHSFKRRLFPDLQAIARHFGTPFHIYDETGIWQTGGRLKTAFAWTRQLREFDEYFAVKALPNPAILSLMDVMGFGFDCSSIPELRLARRAAHSTSSPGIMFTSNNTTREEFDEALSGGDDCVVNLDDISLILKLAATNKGRMPKLICFRYNPGPRRTGNAIIGEPKKAKYGITHSQVLRAYAEARRLGAEEFGLHTMVCSNELNYRYMVETVRSLLGIAKMLHRKLGIRLDFINMGGGIGIPYRPTDTPFDLEALAREIKQLFCDFERKEHWVPRLCMESGRFMTGPHGVLVARPINRKETYQTHVGVDTGMPALMRPAMYGAYHNITVVDSRGREVGGGSGRLARPIRTVNIVGSICENCDRLATDRKLPEIRLHKDLIVTEDTGAHGLAMGFNYNGRLRPKELLLCRDGSVKLIRRAEKIEDLFATLKFQPKIWKQK